MKSLWPLAIALISCSPAAPAPSQLPSPPAPKASADASLKASPAAKQLTADSPLKTKSGGTFTVPKGWWVTQLGDAVKLEGPDRELRMWVLDLPSETAEQAIVAAWKLVQPGFDLEVDEGDPDFLRHIERVLCWLLLRPGSLRCKPNGEGEDGSRSIQLTQSAFKLGVHNPCITILLE